MVADWLWVVWIVACLATFGVLEGIAIVNRTEGDTLTENLKRWLGIDPPRPWKRAGIATFTSVVLGFVSWFVPHITG